MKSFAIALALLVSLSSGAEEIEDPWALMPALPNDCYQADDDFVDRAYAAMETLSTEQTRQDGINEELSQQSSNMNPMEQQQRMMDFMMENPQEAQKYMEAVAAVGATGHEYLSRMGEETGALQKERDALDAEYDAAVRALDDTYASSTAGTFEDPKKFDADLAKYHAAVDAYNAGYENICASLWQDRYPGWLARYEALQRRTVAWANESDVSTQNYAILGIDATNYRRTDGLSAAHGHIQAAAQIYNRRKLEPVIKDDFVPGP
jgi:hypothetical protein